MKESLFRTAKLFVNTHDRKRPTKLGVKKWLFFGCRKAGHRAAILYTIVENCRRLGIDTREYLEANPAKLARARQGKQVRIAA